MATNWEHAPWMMEGGVKHSVNVARLLAYVAFGGREGIVGTRDLAVRETLPASPQVRVFPGACAILNDGLNVAYEAYAARLPEQDLVTISATGSGAGRCDLIVAQIKNPYQTGETWQRPSDAEVAAETAEFVGTGIISLGVRSTHPSAAEVIAACRGKSCLPLASVLLPANTATVTQAMIQDCRRVVVIGESQGMAVKLPGSKIDLNTTAYKNIASVQVDVPSWATHYDARAMCAGPYFGSPQSRGTTRLLLVDGQVNMGGQTTAWDEDVAKGGATRSFLMCADTNVPIPAASRGKTLSLFMQGARTSGTAMTVDTATSVAFDWGFKAIAEQPEGF